MPILISEKLGKLSPRYFFLGGGHADVKLRRYLHSFKITITIRILIGVGY